MYKRQFGVIVTNHYIGQFGVIVAKHCIGHFGVIVANHCVGHFGVIVTNHCVRIRKCRQNVDMCLDMCTVQARTGGGGALLRDLGGAPGKSHGTPLDMSLGQ